MGKKTKPGKKGRIAQKKGRTPTMVADPSTKKSECNSNGRAFLESRKGGPTLRAWRTGRERNKGRVRVQP